MTKRYGVAVLFAAAALAVAIGGGVRAAEMPVKAPPPAPAPGFVNSGIYVGVLTEMAVASSALSGSSGPILQGGSLTAAGGRIGFDVGYIQSVCILSTWCQVEFDLKYQNINGGNQAGSIQSRMSMSLEFDIGADVIQALMANIGSVGSGSGTGTILGLSFPTFDPNGLLPRNARVAASPRQYFGIVGEGYLTSGQIGAASGQNWVFAFGPTMGFRWQSLNSAGAPVNGSLSTFAKLEFASQGVDVSGVFAAPGGAPLRVQANGKMDTIAFAGIKYDFGVNAFNAGAFRGL